MDQPINVTWTQRAYLSFSRQGDHGDPPYTPSQLDEMAFDPDQITELVGLMPTRSWRRGDPSPHRNGAATRNFANWSYELPPQDTPYSEPVLVALLDAVAPVADGIRNACQTLGLQVHMTLVIEAHGYRDEGESIVSSAAISYSTRTIQRLAELGASLDHDQYYDIS